MREPPRSAYPGIFFLALSVILLQIALTRVFAIMLWHHLTYMVVSVALLGFGASGSILTAQRASMKSGSPIGAMAVYSAAYGVSILAAFATLQLIDIDSFKLWENKTNLLSLLALYLITAGPFLLAGMAIGTALTRCVQQVNRLYFSDLLGSGIGGVASVFLLASFGGSATVVIAAGVAFLAAFLFGLGASRGIRVLTGVGLIFGLVASLSASGWGSAVGLPHWEWHPPFATGKEFADIRDPSQIDRLYSATAEVEVGPDHEAMLVLGGDLGHDATEVIKARFVGQDGTAPTMLLAGASDLDRFEFVRNTQPASALVAFEARGGTAPDVMVIGVGGGVDVMIALAGGARHVTAVEINTAMIEAVTERYDEYLGGLFRPGAHPYSDRVRLVNWEGRAFARSRPDRYDIIQMSGVDSFTALSTGAYTLSESYLYTKDAVADFYEHLNDGGYINYSRFLAYHPRKPRETLRLANIAYEALGEMGIEDPASHIVVFQGQAWASTMIKRGPFTAIEIAALERFATEQGFYGLLFDPLRGGAPTDSARRIDRTPVLDKVLDPMIRGTMPQAALSSFAVIKQSLTEAYAAVLALDREALDAQVENLAARFEGEDRAQVRAAAIAILGQLSGATYGPMKDFVPTAVVFHDLLGGSDAERRAFVDAYPYDISACTDDTPFFFNYYRYAQLFTSAAGLGDKGSDSYTPEFPVGHMVLLASLVQITLLALVLIFVPLRGLAREGLKAADTGRYFAYFAALGMGFMLIEIVLMQKMVVFLGHPTYAVSVVLASLLSFAGFGSLLAGRMRILSRRNLLLLGCVIAALVVGVSVFMNVVLPDLLGQPLGIRITIAVLAMLPIGIALGMPFPTGMRIVEANCPQLLPWCWAINGFLSVFSSVFCIVLSMFVGFTYVLWAAAAVYAVGLAAMPAARIAPAAGAPAG